MKGMEGLGLGLGSKEIAQNSAVAIVRGLAHSSRRERVRLSQSERKREEQFRKFCETERGFETNEVIGKLRVFVLVRERWKLECPRVIRNG